MKDRKILIGTALALLLLLTTGFSYAYFSTAVKGNDNAKDVIVEAGTLKLTYTDGPAINVQNIKPGWTTTKTVSVKNNGTLDTAYNIVWQELTNTILKNELVLSSTCKRLNESGAVEGTCEPIDELPVRAKRIAKNISIESGFTHEYTFTFLFKETNESQNYNQGKQFNGVLGIEEYKDTAVYCTYDGELTQGAEYTNGYYTYRYMQESSYNGEEYLWRNITEDGWGVAVTNRNLTSSIDSNGACTYINNKPVVSMDFMFFNSHAASIDLTGFDTSTVTSMGNLFGRSKATKIILNDLDTSNVTDMVDMFASSQVEIITGLSDLDTSNVTDMCDMFYNTKITTIDLSSFDTSNVTDMSFMFKGCQAVTIDLSSFDTSNVTNMQNMFNGVTNLKTIYVSDKFNTDKVTVNGEIGMFASCTNLVGGAGTKYDSTKTDKTYARIDGGTSNPGYFTDIADKK